MNLLDLEEHNRNRLAEKRAKNTENLLKEEPDTRVGYYQGYEASTGKYIVKLPDGSTYRGKLISNAAIAIGAKVQLTIPLNGTPVIKSNPV